MPVDVATSTVRLRRMDVDLALRAIAVIAAAAAVGQVVSRRLPIPLPVFLLAAGLALGGSGLDIVRTNDLSDLVRVIVSVAVALIVFEGGTLLNWRLVRVLGPVVRNMVVGGLLLTTIVGMLAAHFALGFGWRLAALFGALVCVTGPSVIIPLLRSVRVNERLRAILMGEAIIIDPLGALLTLFLLQLAVSSSFMPAGPALWVVKQVVVGVAVGAAGAAVVVIAPRVVRRMSGREISLLVTAAAVTAFAIAQSLASDAGLTAMVVMGIALGNLSLPHRESMGEFQESIVAFLVASVYVLLAASVSVHSVLALWPEGFIVVAVLIFAGRPLLIAVSTAKSDLSWRERAFLAAVAPRGVVAASLAGVVALEAKQGLGASESEFVAMVFVVITVTIALQSAYAQPLARLLRVYPMTTVIAGAGETGRRAATKLVAAGEQVLIVEADEEAAVRAREAGFEVLIGDITSVDTLRKAGVDEARAFLLTTPDDSRNLLAAQLARSTLGCERIFARVTEAANVPAFEELGVAVVNPAEAVAAELASIVAEPALRDVIAQADDVEIARFVVTNPAAQRAVHTIPGLAGALVVLVRRGPSSVVPDGRTVLRPGDVVTVFGKADALGRARAALTLRAGEFEGL